MNKKNNVKKTAALLLGLALAVGSVGCDFIITDSAKDLDQVVAEVDISKNLGTDDKYSDVESDLKTVINEILTVDKKKVTGSISKRDLVAYFLSTGYQYVENYGYTYEDTFNMLMDGLVSREIMIQYAIAYYLHENPELTAAGCKAYMDAQTENLSETEKKLFKNNPEVLALKYFLTENGKDNEAYDRTVYNLKKSLNDSLDSLEKGFIKAETEPEETQEETRTLPTGVGVEKEDYYDKTGTYNVYTGRNTLDVCGSYEKLNGSTTSTRRQAYNSFLANLQTYNMISTSGGVEDTSNVLHLNYYYVELSSLLGQALINKYFDALTEKSTESLSAEYVAQKYSEILETQKDKYDASPDTFASDMDKVSDSAFMLHGLENFGYVYNILLPFSNSQKAEYTTAQNNKANTQDDLYRIRKNILANVKAKDLRGSWITDPENYSYEEGGKHYFFKNNLSGDTQYEQLKQYKGDYAYNGDAETQKPTPISIDEFMVEFENHIDHAVADGADVTTKDTTYVYTYNDENKPYTVKGEVQYDKFVYYKGKVDLGEVKAEDYFWSGSAIYKAVSAVNELMFAYSTDTGCLNTYYGYAVSPYTTNFVKEFEYAAQMAVAEGVGSYVVCATEYGWHIIFASYVYSADGAVNGEYNHADAVGENKKEGSFSNLFYESLKAKESSNYSTKQQNHVLNQYNNDDNVTLYKSRYKDLLELKNQ